MDEQPVIIENWKEVKRAIRLAREGNVVIYSHPWHSEKMGQAKVVTKIMCSDKEKLLSWGNKRGLPLRAFHDTKKMPHYDIWGERAEAFLLTL